MNSDGVERFKYPNLTELFSFACPAENEEEGVEVGYNLFDPENGFKKHDARNDVQVLHRAMQSLMRRGILSLPI